MFNDPEFKKEMQANSLSGGLSIQDGVVREMCAPHADVRCAQDISEDAKKLFEKGEYTILPVQEPGCCLLL